MENKKAIEAKPLRQYRCIIPNWSRDYDYETTVIARSHSQARYRTWYNLYVDDIITSGYKDWLSEIKVKSLGLLNARYYFMPENEFNRMKEHRSLDFAYMGQRVEICGKKGIITGYVGFNLAVMFDGSSHPHSNCHPHYKVKYFDNDGNVIKEYNN